MARSLKDLTSFLRPSTEQPKLYTLHAIAPCNDWVGRELSHLHAIWSKAHLGRKKGQIREVGLHVGALYNRLPLECKHAGLCEFGRCVRHGQRGRALAGLHWEASQHA